jgi:UDP-2,3-diacylglucosamine pyrophosphatase LpxH
MSILFISDLHLGSNKAKAGHLLEFLKLDKSSITYLVGDIIDIWSLRQSFVFSREVKQIHTDCVRKFLKRAAKRDRLYYIYGNHDEFLADFVGMADFMNIELQEQASYTASDGRKYLVIHGHQFDILSTMRHGRLVGKIGDMGYDILIELNEIYNKIRGWLGLKYFSLSKMIKVKVKKAASFIQNFETSLAEYAALHGYDGVICGHIHEPANKMVNGVHYLNCGCWTDIENLTYIIDKLDGAGLKLERHFAKEMDGSLTHVA